MLLSSYKTGYNKPFFKCPVTHLSLRVIFGAYNTVVRFGSGTVTVRAKGYDVISPTLKKNLPQSEVRMNREGKQGRSSRETNAAPPLTTCENHRPTGRQSLQSRWDRSFEREKMAQLLKMCVTVRPPIRQISRKLAQKRKCGGRPFCVAKCKITL